MNFETYEASDYGHDLNLVIILHSLRVSYQMRSGCGEKEGI
jgi:hypothetical protein